MTEPISIRFTRTALERLAQNKFDIGRYDPSGGPIPRVRGLHHVERVEGGRADDAGELRVPVHLLDVGLPLVDEVELRRQVGVPPYDPANALTPGAPAPAPDFDAQLAAALASVPPPPGPPAPSA